MPSTMTFKQDYKRDATLIHAGMHGGRAPLVAMGWGWLPDDLQAHANWLRRQPEKYLQQVYKEVIRIEDGD